jgi:DNA polymerase-4
VGVAPNKFLAKLASDLEKPDGLVVIAEEEKEERIAALPASRLWGVGEATLKELEKLGVSTIGEVRALGRDVLEEKFGKAGGWIYERSRGIDESQVTPDRESKSIGAETTFPEDIVDLEVLERTLLELAERVGFRLRDAGLKGKTITLKARFASFKTVTRNLTLPEPTASTTAIYRHACWLMTGRLKLGRQALRLLGVTVSQLSGGLARQQSLFQEPDKARLERLEKTIDKIRGKLGRQAVKRGRLLKD